MALIIQQLINGIALGSIYALIALGYTMVYGVLRLINFAHGDVFMVGAFTGYFVATGVLWRYLMAPSQQPLALLFSLLFAMLICACLSFIIEKGAYKPLRKAPRLSALITAIGISLLLENLGIVTVGASPRSFPQFISSKPHILYKSPSEQTIAISDVQIVILAVCIFLMLLLQFIIYQTKIGKAMRAVSYDRETAQLMGINVDNIISVTFLIGSALAAAAGVLFAIQYPSIEPLMGILPGIKAFVAAVLGGIGIIPGAVLGSYIMGVTETSVAASPVLSTYRDAIAFIILILILLFKPTGILGKETYGRT